MRISKMIVCTDISKLESLGFTYCPPYYHTHAFWRKENVTVKPTIGRICILNASIRNLEVFAEMVKAGIVEFVEYNKIHNVKMTEEEYLKYLEEEE